MEFLIFVGVLYVIWLIISEKKKSQTSAHLDPEMLKAYEYIINQSKTKSTKYKHVEDETESGYQTNVDRIRAAINESRRVEFLYRKPTDEHYKKRTVDPRSIISVDHEDGFGSTLCIKGYCHLRKAERVFAFKRMKNLNVL